MPLSRYGTKSVTNSEALVLLEREFVVARVVQNSTFANS